MTKLKHPPLSSAPKKSPRSASSGYRDTLQQARSHMSLPAQIFSRFIHLRPIEIISDLLAMTLFRPLPLVFAAASAALLPLVIWLIAKHFGYSLSGTESIIAFIFGWLVGVIVDYTKILITGKSTT